MVPASLQAARISAISASTSSLSVRVHQLEPPTISRTLSLGLAYQLFCLLQVGLNIARLRCHLQSCGPELLLTGNLSFNQGWTSTCRQPAIEAMPAHFQRTLGGCSYICYLLVDLYFVSTAITFGSTCSRVSLHCNALVESNTRHSSTVNSFAKG